MQNYSRSIDKLRRFLFSSKCIQVASDNGEIDICFDFAIGMTIPDCTMDSRDHPGAPVALRKYYIHLR